MLPWLMRRGWMLVFRGVAAVLFGVLALLAPEFALLFLVVLGTAYALTGGLSSLRSHVPDSRNGAPPALAAGPGRQRWGRCWHDDPALVGNTGNGRRCAPGWVGSDRLDPAVRPAPRVEAFLSIGIRVGPCWAGGVCPWRAAAVLSQGGHRGSRLVCRNLRAPLRGGVLGAGISPPLADEAIWPPVCTGGSAREGAPGGDPSTKRQRRPAAGGPSLAQEREGRIADPTRSRCAAWSGPCNVW